MLCVMLLLTTAEARWNKVQGFFYFACFEEGEYYDSIQELLESENDYLSYRDEEGHCYNINFTAETSEKLFRGIQRLFDDLSSPRPLNAINTFEYITVDTWNAYLAEVRECWNSKADAAGISQYNDENNDYKLVVYDPDEHTSNDLRRKIANAGGVYSRKDNTVYIHPGNIKRASIHGQPPKNFYDILVYVLIHEAIHAKRLGGDPSKLKPTREAEERHVQQLAYDFYKEIFGKEPPYAYIDLSAEEIETLEQERLKLEKQYTDLWENLDNLNNTDLVAAWLRLQYIENRINEITSQLYDTPSNDDYDRITHKLEPCP